MMVVETRNFWDSLACLLVGGLVEARRGDWEFSVGIGVRVLIIRVAVCVAEVLRVG